jgi:hypothetical protein
MLLPLARQTLQNKLNEKLEEQGMMTLIIRLCSDNLPRLLQIATVMLRLRPIRSLEQIFIPLRTIC